MIQQQKSPVRLAPVQGFNSKNSRSNHTQKRTEPPYAKQIGQGSSLLVFFGSHSCWDMAKRNNARGRDSVALPVGETPDSKTWKCAEGRSIVCLEMDDTGPAFRMDLVRVLAAYFAFEVVLIPFDVNPKNAVFWGC